MPEISDPQREWLEADGLGGFAMGTPAGIRTRRYHGLLLVATTPPTGRVMLVNGYEAEVVTAAGRYPLTTQKYAPDVLHPAGFTYLEAFTNDPWPRWRYRFPDGTEIESELFVQHGAARTVLRFRCASGRGPVRLELRLLCSGRDYHALQRENPAFRFEVEQCGHRARLQPYPDRPAIVWWSNGDYRHAPEWYRNFLYSEEKRRGLDFIEDLASPGVLSWDLKDVAVLILGAELGGNAEGLSNDVSASTSASTSTSTSTSDDPVVAAEHAATRERARRSAFATQLHRAADAYVVRRGSGATLIAGYPWFTDWGRDTFIALRGLCIATGRLDLARQILLEWSGAVSQGMLPNRFPDGGEAPEYNSVDASLWYVIAVAELERAYAMHDAPTPARDSCATSAPTSRLEDAHDARHARLPGRPGCVADSDRPRLEPRESERGKVAMDVRTNTMREHDAHSPARSSDAGPGTPHTSEPDRQPFTASERAQLRAACDAILDGYTRGTRHGIRQDEDGLLAAGEPGVQLTWMDAKVGDWVVTPRIGKPVEVQALWLNALAIGGAWSDRWRAAFERGRATFEQCFWNEARGALYDVIDVDHQRGAVDPTFRPNQIFAVGGLPQCLVSRDRAARMIANVEAELLTPLGPRSLARGERDYQPHYEGGPRERDGGYHQGTVWPWLIGPFVEAYVRVHGDTERVRSEARRRFLDPLLAEAERGFGHLTEVTDADPPFAAGGCPCQAWSLGELLRLDRVVLASKASPHA